MIIQSVQMNSDSIRSGGKLVLVGDGGSAADWHPLAAELISCFIN